MKTGNNILRFPVARDASSPPDALRAGSRRPLALLGGRRRPPGEPREAKVARAVLYLFYAAALGFVFAVFIIEAMRRAGGAP